MKKYIGIAILAIVVALIAMGSFVVYDSRDYFKDLFDAERRKLNLRSEASVDSLQTVITRQRLMIDSLQIVVSKSGELSNEKEQLYKKQIASQQKTISNLQNVISHQNTIIDDLRGAK